MKKIGCLLGVLLLCLSLNAPFAIADTVELIDTGAGQAHSFSVPNGCTYVEIQQVGGGGGGSNGGGGSGGSNHWIITVPESAWGTYLTIFNGVGGGPGTWNASAGFNGTHTILRFPLAISGGIEPLDLIAGGGEGGLPSVQGGAGGAGGNCASNTSDQGGQAIFPVGWHFSQFNGTSVYGENGTSSRYGHGGNNGDTGGGGNGGMLGRNATRGAGGYTRVIIHIEE